MKKHKSETRPLWGDLIGFPIAAGIVITYMLNGGACFHTEILLKKGYTEEQIEEKGYRIVTDNPIMPNRADLVELTAEISQGYKFYKVLTRPGRELGYLGERIKDFADAHLLETIINADRKVGKLLFGEEYGRYEGEEYYKIDE